MNKVLSKVELIKPKLINFIIVIFLNFLLNVKNMSSELHKYIENAIEKKEKLFNAEVLDFPKDKKQNNSKKNLKFNNNSYWNITDNSNSDQQKAITGICLMFGFLLVIGLIANFTSI